MIREWQEELNGNITKLSEISEKLNMSPDQEEQLERIARRFPLSVPRYYLSLIDWSDPEDPIRKMCIPSLDELEMEGSFDTSGEAQNTVMPGMQHKYNETALILSNNQCAMYCRHCFRKRLVGVKEDEIGGDILRMAGYVADHPQINNVLITGGDFLMNSNSQIVQYLEAFCRMDQLDFIRLGSRMPVVLPGRITSDPELLDILNFYNRRKQLYLITQFNHPNECTPKAKVSIKAIQELGIPVKNQAVLLKGVNDDSNVLAKLFRSLTSWGIVGHYIFQCRPVRGVGGRFQVSIKMGCQLVNDANAKQNGLGKSADYTMSHRSGKIRILGETEEGKMLFKYQQARNRKDIGRIFALALEEDQCWLPDSNSLPV
ncbi:KamA family radical SAM protein [Parasporobacterium paucivorans]|uniref:KamA family protein n=1 Tax=Parasporobacterium paucivorans DSM 15970 TaxID=1122934 RepID=A0A1M6E6V8_9FIRM|nr:KamA family radical SAM protein [Parasporobacterium paucivorans]SHI81226.1 KamA family protein [Parasporobacterium paucivorans DSM 15970]